MYRRDSLRFNLEEIETLTQINEKCLSKGLISKNSKSTILSTLYRPPDNDFKAFKTFLKDLYSTTLKTLSL